MTWWSEHREVYFSLMTLATAAPWDVPKGHPHRVYSDGTLSFHDDEISGNFDEVEEQLWAFRNGLSDIVFHIAIPNIRKRFPANKYTLKHKASVILNKRVGR